MPSSEPHRFLVVEGDDSLRQSLETVAEAQAVAADDISTAINDSLQHGRPYSLAILMDRRPADDLIRAIELIRAADAEIQLLVAAEDVAACRRDLEARTEAGHSIPVVPRAIDAAALRSLAVALAGAGDVMRVSNLRCRDFEESIVRLSRQIEEEHIARLHGEEQLRHDALHDPLTGLATRALLLDRIRRNIERAKREPDHQIAVLFIDLDRFQAINDSLGHAAGDQLLVDIAMKITMSVRAIDTVARFESDQVARLSGDEFALLLEPIRGPADAVRVAERLLQALAGPFLIAEHELFTTPRIGIAFGTADCHRPEDLLHDANAALHQAKADGKSPHRIYNPDIHTRANQRLALESELRKAIEHDQLVLCYQPIHALATRRLVEFEALVRWRHPRRGLMPPSEFIALAEETGLIAQLGSWVLRSACRQHKKWRRELADMSQVSIGVNVSARQFVQADFVSEVKSTLSEAGMEGRNLSLEITETTIMETGAPTIKVLDALHRLGIQLHLDDFGTGYSSLAYLRQLPLDVLKIDRSFVTDMSSGKTGRAIVQAIIGLAHSMNLRVIAEGVETALQGSMLIDLGCDSGQGFLFARPLPEAEVLDYSRHILRPVQPGIAV
jgi:diguanylate cyclase (GGDEF)-like protein